MLGLGLGLRSMGQSLQQKAMSILRSFGSNASSYPFATRQGAYQTSAGPAAAAVNDPVGLELDAMGTVGPELVTNGANFVNTAGWAGKAGASVSAVGGNLVCTAGASVYGSASYAITLVVGKTYRLAFDLISNAGAAGMYAFVSDDSGGDTNRSLALNSPDTPGNTTVYFTAITDASFIVIGAGQGGFDPGETFALNNISCVQVTGNHATQTTAINRPTVQRGLWNLLPYSQAFNTGWIPVRCSIPGGYSDPYGGLLAYKLIEDSSSNSHTLLQGGVTTVSGMKYSQAIFAKAGERSIVQVSSANGVFTTFNLSSAAVTGGSGSMLAIGGGWYLCTANYTAVASGPDTTYLWPIVSGTTNDYPGDGVSGLYIYMAGWFQGTLTATQILQQGGIPLTTSAAGSNPTAGNYNAHFASGQSLTVALPAGYESATTIDSTAAGQVTLTEQNLVGTYTINTDTYGRLVIKDSSSVSAAQLAILQQYADSLAGL